MSAFRNLSTMRSLYKIDKSFSEAEAIAAIQGKVNKEPVVDDTPLVEERIASALEYQVLSSMPDDETVTA